MSRGDKARAGERAYRAVIAYKLGKAALEAIAGLGLLAAARLGAAARLHDVAVGLRAHVVHRATAELIDLLASVSTPSALTFAAIGLSVDAALSGVEGWCLVRRARWAPWLVVATTGALVPLELVELVERASLGRAGLLLVNLAIVVVLVRRARTHAGASA